MTKVSVLLKPARAAGNRIVSFVKSQPTSRLYVVASIITLASLIFGAVMVALNNALFFDGWAEDGAFQLLNPLRRIVEDGQVIGRDFNFFHGVGVPLIHLPFYLLFGQGVFGDEMARWLVSPVVFLASTYAVFYFWRRSWRFALSMTAIVSLISMLLVPMLAQPITSILAVRAVMPVFLLAVILNQKRLQRAVIGRGPVWLRSWTRYELAVALTLGLAVVCGTEFGVAAILAFGITHVLYRTDKQRFAQRLLGFGRVVLGTVATTLVLLTVITQGHPFTPLKYAFVDIPSDQMWYFGSPPNNFLHIGNIIQSVIHDWLFIGLTTTGLIALVCLIVLHRRRKYRLETQAFLYAWLAGFFSLVSVLGYFHATQLGAWGRMSILVAVSILFICVTDRRKTISLGLEIGKLKRRIRIQPATQYRLWAGSFLVVSLICAVGVFALVKDGYDIMKTFRKTKDHITGVDTNVVSDRWRDIAETIVPVVQADNYVPIDDFTNVGFVHGVMERQLIVRAGDKASFIRHGQVVYLPKAGRQLIGEVAKLDDERLLVTLQSKLVKLDPELDGKPGRLIVAEDFKHDSTKLWSSYTGVLNDEMGLIHPSRGGYDYIIHALGKQRREEYVKDFVDMKPQYVMTFTHAYSGWESWLQSAHWEWYSLLDKNYEAVQISSIYVLWQRKDQPWVNDGYAGANWQKLEVRAGSRDIELPRLSFESVPDMEAYGKQLTQSQLEKLRMMGRPMKDEFELTEDEFDHYVVDMMHEDRRRGIYNRENNGTQTDERTAQSDGEYRAKKEAKGQPSLLVPRPKRQVMLVKVQYELSYSPKVTQPFSRFMRYLVELEGTYSHSVASLRPYANEVVFPVVMSELNDKPYLSIRTDSLFPGSGEVKILSAEWAKLDTSIENLRVLTD